MFQFTLKPNNDEDKDEQGNLAPASTFVPQLPFDDYRRTGNRPRAGFGD
jgi:hypothetical protein